ncbi:hypothetical protein HPB49_014639 [Dermacentor silvarum]|uniref:Uncharacterized protein n=1 Tax=Dermacentor silvarum TaxID=543639 RepID=A0ACB8CXZ0_DERSI|nr:hypothetical protein HPB49_014639 [Dermacentor silvarum]
MDWPQLTRESKHSDSYRLKPTCSISSAELTVRARNGGQTTLPCPLETKTAAGASKPASLDVPPAVSELRWTRLEDPPARRTVYVVDGAEAGVWQGEHVVRPDWQSRSYFSVHSDPALLKIGRVALADSGTFVCSVTFADGRRVNHTVHLRVIDEAALSDRPAGSMLTRYTRAGDIPTPYNSLPVHALHLGELGRTTQDMRQIIWLLLVRRVPHIPTSGDDSD